MIKSILIKFLTFRLLKNEDKSLIRNVLKNVNNAYLYKNTILKILIFSIKKNKSRLSSSQKIALSNLLRSER